MADSFDFSRPIPVPNLIQGVSQQAAQQRRDAQCESQFDCINSVAEGCRARPPAELIKLYSGVDLTGAWFSETFNGNNENYLTGFKADGSAFAYDLSDGTACTIIDTAPDASYFTAGVGVAPRDKLRGQVVDDFTFIANRQMTVEMDPTLSPAKVNEALVFVRATQFNCDYTVILDGVGYTYHTDPGVVAGTGLIASQLKVLIDATPSSPWVVQHSASVLRITKTGGGTFDLVTSDGGGDDDLIGFYGRAKSYTSLPSHGFNGVLLEVKGDSRTGDDDFYVKFNGPTSTGVWDETVAPATETLLDAATMPHILINTGYREFTVRRPSWSTRIAGDTDNAPDPSFVGKRLRDLSFFNRRLTLLHAGGVVFSKTDNPYTFFPDTVQTVLDTAPIDLRVSSGAKNGAAVLDFAVLAAENLFLWAQRVQFRVSSGQQPFKQNSVENLPAMAYEYSPNAYPLALGSSLYMTTDSGLWASLRAMQFSSGKLAGDTDVSSHVGQYIPSGVRILTATETMRQLFILGDGDPTTITVFGYTSDGEQYIQAAFNKWRIPGGPILWASVADNTLRIFQQRPEGVALLRVALTPNELDAVSGAEYKTRLDIRVDQTQVTGLSYNATSGTTSFTLPYTPVGNELQVVLADSLGERTRGRVYPVVSMVGPVVTVTGDLTGGTFYVGHRIIAERTESEFFIRGDSGAEPVDRLTVNKFKLSCSKTGYSRIEVTPKRGTPRVYEYPVRKLGAASADTGPPNITTDDFDADVSELSKEVTIRLVNDSFLPSNWQNAAYDVTAVGWRGGK